MVSTAEQASTRCRALAGNYLQTTFKLVRSHLLTHNRKTSLSILCQGRPYVVLIAATTTSHLPVEYETTFQLLSKSPLNHVQAKIGSPNNLLAHVKTHKPNNDPADEEAPSNNEEETDWSEVDQEHDTASEDSEEETASEDEESTNRSNLDQEEKTASEDFEEATIENEEKIDGSNIDEEQDKTNEGFEETASDDEKTDGSDTEREMNDKMVYS